ncbi:MAG TPA: type I DNA topoisomerase [Candidatus Tripitaka californicus]|uniref:type I DNA topoisomerase n=2 Tax=Candidatus Tripitaka californicus TaxID=3367616 RepID=UPI0040275265
MGKRIRVVIVESPTKAKTINKFLGSEYKVCSSKGHVRDLPEGKLSVDVENGFEPQYQIIPRQKEVVKTLKKETEKAEQVYLAPDEDREGEAIAWHLCHALELPEDKVKRVVFHEITPKAIERAFQNPGAIDMNKVNAQQARRILDRLVGYQLSPLLWKKVAKGLSAGRVQSVAVRLLVEREKEVQSFQPKEYWEITAKLRPKGSKENEFLARLWKEDEKEVALRREAEANRLVALLKKSRFVVSAVNKQRRRNTSPPPFITSQLQQQGSIQLRFSAKKTMLLAQQLYEGVELPEGPVGLITYMRTDSYHISQEALEAVRNLIPKKFGKEYLPPEPNHFPSRKGAQEAHEAIRPTYVERTPEEVKPYLTGDQYKLYELIWGRFVACQMMPALYDLTEVQIAAGNCLFRAKGRVLVFPGHTLLTGPMEEEALPELKEGGELELLKLEPSQHFTEPPPRYTEATLIKTLEKKGIGRPSTYAPIISTIQDRGYVKKEKSTLIPTELGILVTDKLVQHFPRIMDVEFTSSMEEGLDKIEEARADWVGVLQGFYDPFRGELEKATKEMRSEKGVVEEGNLPCKLCGSPMVVRWSKTGKFLGCSAYPKCKNTSPLTTDELPAEIPPCEKCGSSMSVRSGRYGNFLGCTAYPECKNTRPLTTKDQPPLEVPPCDKCGSPMAIKRGRYGNFLGCTAYPNCKNIKPLATGVKCPQEGCDGELVQKQSKNGRKFFGCSKYPQCKYATSKLPEKHPVPETTAS